VGGFMWNDEQDRKQVEERHSEAETTDTIRGLRCYGSNSGRRQRD
jgi:hypothetical protein